MPNLAISLSLVSQGQRLLGRRSWGSLVLIPGQPSETRKTARSCFPDHDICRVTDHPMRCLLQAPGWSRKLQIVARRDRIGLPAVCVIQSVDCAVDFSWSPVSQAPGLVAKDGWRKHSNAKNASRCGYDRESQSKTRLTSMQSESLLEEAIPVPQPKKPDRHCMSDHLLVPGWNAAVRTRTPCPRGSSFRAVPELCSPSGAVGWRVKQNASARMRPGRRLSDGPARSPLGCQAPRDVV